ncbi:MAG: sodium:solute symporter family protein [Verrucomicrobiota bacterium]
MDIIGLPSNFATLDWVIVVVYLAASLAVGIFANRFIHSISAYLVGGRASGTSLNVATYIGTGLGLVTLMYAAIDGFSHGFAYVTLAPIGFFTGVVLGTTGIVISPLRKLKLLTIPEYFERRFNRRTRVVGGVICAVAGILNMGLFPKMGAVFITYATGLHLHGDQELLVNLITSVLIIMVLVYTTLGGMVSVIITDYVQFVVLSFGMGLGVYFCLVHPELGWDTMLNALSEHRGERMFNPVAEGGYGWMWIAFNLLVFFVAGFCWAPEASRALTARNPKSARLTFLLASPAQFVRVGIPALWAVAAFTLVSKSPELTGYFFPEGFAGPASHAAEAMPMALGAIVPTGLLGILVAGLMAAFMSTHDSYLLCWSSVIARDVISPLRGGSLTGKQEIRATRIGVVAIGIFLLVWGIWYELPESVWTYMAVSGAVYTSGAGIVLLGGLYWKRASSAGALAALLTGLVALFGLFLDPVNAGLSELFNREVSISGHALGFATFFLCAIVFVVVSLLRPDKKEDSP